MRAKLAVAPGWSGGSEQGTAFLAGDPAQKDRPPRAQLRAEPKNGNARARRKVINLAPASARAEQKFGDLVGAAEQIVREFISSGVCWLQVHADHPSCRLVRERVLNCF
jgi:hypothetical protein